MSVPTVIALKDGKIIDQFIGVKQADELHKFVDKVLEQFFEPCGSITVQCSLADLSPSIPEWTK